MTRSGSATRSIGRRLRDSSPSSTASPAAPARMPARSRIVVPELPQSIAWRPPAPRPGPAPPIRTTPRPSSTVRAPSAAIAPSDERTSPPPGTPRMVVVPSARAPIRIARCAIDLSPGTSSVPASPVRGGPTRTSLIVPADALARASRRREHRLEPHAVAGRDQSLEAVERKTELRQGRAQRVGVRERDVAPDLGGARGDAGGVPEAAAGVVEDLAAPDPDVGNRV